MSDPCKNPFHLPVLLILPLLFAPTAQAQIEEEYERWSVDVERYDLDIRLADASIFDTTLTFVGAQGWQGFGPHVSAALRGGFADYQQNDNPLLNGLDPGNFFIGFGFDAHGRAEKRVSPMLRAYFDYVDLEDSNELRKAKIDFFSLTVRAGARLRLGRVQWRFGGIAYYIDGNEEITGDVESKRELEVDESLAAFTELEFPLGADGSFAVGLEGGGRRGWIISFAKEF